MCGERRDRVHRACCSHLTQCSETCMCLSTACAASHGMLFVPHYVVQCATSVAMSTVLTRLCRSALFPWTVGVYSPCITVFSVSLCGV